MSDWRSFLDQGRSALRFDARLIDELRGKKFHKIAREKERSPQAPLLQRLFATGI
jgi:hypothetical protein